MPSTFHPNEAWVKEQASAFLKHARETGLDATVVMHDRDTKFIAAFDDVLESANIEVKTAAYRSPNTNAFVERFIQTLQQECLDYFIVFGQQHMDHIVSEMVAYYHEERPHQAKDNDLLMLKESSLSSNICKPRKYDPPPDAMPVSHIACSYRLGGLLKHYYRKAG